MPDESLTTIGVEFLVKGDDILGFLGKLDSAIDQTARNLQDLDTEALRVFERVSERVAGVTGERRPSRPAGATAVSPEPGSAGAPQAMMEVLERIAKFTGITTDASEISMRILDDNLPKISSSTAHLPDISKGVNEIADFMNRLEEGVGGPVIGFGPGPGSSGDEGPIRPAEAARRRRAAVPPPVPLEEVAERVEETVLRGFSEKEIKKFIPNIEQLLTGLIDRIGFIAGTIEQQAEAGAEGTKVALAEKSKRGKFTEQERALREIIDLTNENLKPFFRRLGALDRELRGLRLPTARPVGRGESELRTGVVTGRRRKQILEEPQTTELQAIIDEMIAVISGTIKAGTAKLGEDANEFLQGLRGVFARLNDAARSGELDSELAQSFRDGLAGAEVFP
jgi:hypothetical protein